MAAEAVALVLLHGFGVRGPHDVPVLVAAPGVVAVALAEEADALPSHPFDAVAAPDLDLAGARARVGAGDAAGALVVDLRGTRDVLVVGAAQDAKLVAAVVAQTRAVEAGYQRTVSVQTLPPALGPDWSGSARRHVLVLAGSVAGFLLMVAISLVFGPVAPSLRLGLRRVGAIAVVSIASGAVALLAGPVSVGVVVGAVTAAAALVTLALEALAGLGGLGVAAASFGVLASPLLIGTDPRLLPGPAAAVLGWTPAGAADGALLRLALGAAAGRGLLVIGGWGALALLALAVARRTRPSPRRAASGAWRLQVIATVAVAALILVASSRLVPAAARPEAVPSHATGTECVATGAVDSVEDLNRVAGRLRGGPEFEGGDVGADVLLQDGRRLWMFGDTLRGETEGGDTQDAGAAPFVRNSMLIVGPDCIRAVVPQDRGAIIPDRGDGVGYWPMSVVRTQRPGYDLVTVTAQRVRTTGSGALAFANLGPAVAVFVVRRGGTPQLVRLVDVGPDRTDRNAPTWGAATASDPDWVYLYGTANPGTDLVFGYSLRVARARPDDLTEPSRWSYWDGHRWSADAARAATLVPATGGVSQTLSVFRQDGTWYALSKRDDFLGTDLTVWTAPSPTGPFTRHAALAQLPSDTVKGLLRYMPLAHPDLLPEKGTVVVSYSRNRTDVGTVLRDPLQYRPQFLRVRLP